MVIQVLQFCTQELSTIKNNIMRVFVTGATGFVDSAVVNELISAGHQVLGLTRSENGAKALLAAGAEVHHGDLEDLDSLRRAVNLSDGVIHTGFIHDFTRFKACCEIDKLAIETMGEALAGSDRPIVITSAIGILGVKDRLAVEGDTYPADGPNPRIATERAVDSIAAKGVKVSVVRLSPTVHDEGDHGFVPMLIDIAAKKGISVYKGEGLNRWPAVHRLDAARLFRLALEKESAPGTRYHAVAEEGIFFKEIAEAIGSGLHIPVESKSPEEATSHFGSFAHFAGLDCPASSQLTQESLSWEPMHKVLKDDLITSDYFKNTKV